MWRSHRNDVGEWSGMVSGLDDTAKSGLTPLPACTRDLWVPPSRRVVCHSFVMKVFLAFDASSRAIAFFLRSLVLLLVARGIVGVVGVLDRSLGATPAHVRSKGKHRSLSTLRIQLFCLDGTILSTDRWLD